MQQKEFVKFFKADSWKNTICLFFLSVIICSMMYSWVNPLVDRLMPIKSITLTVNATDRETNEIWLNDDSSGNNLFSACVSDADSSMWEYRDAEEYQYSANTLLSYGDNEGATFTITAPVKSNSYLMFWRHMGCGEVTIDVDGKEYIVDTQSDPGNYYRFYPFQDSYLPFIARAIVYAILIPLTFCIFIAIYHYVTSRKKQCILSKYEFKLWYIFPLWLILYLYALMQYKIGIPNYLVFGDQIYYWLGDLFKQNNWNPFTTDWAEYVATLTASFRGYWCNMFPSLAQTAGNWFHVDPVCFYLLAPSAAIAWLTGYIFPAIYSLSSQKKASILHVLISLAIILFFWNGTLTAILTDLVAVVFFLNGILFAFKFIELLKWKYAFGAGLCLSIACNYRTAYQYGIYIFIIVLFVVKVHQLESVKVLWKSLKGRKKQFKKFFIGLLYFICAFLIVAFPQYRINQVKGHQGFLPYDFEGAWVLGNDPADTTHLEAHANNALNQVYTGYPYPVTDEQMHVIGDQLYNRDDFLQIPQIFTAYATSPLESLQYVAKKILLAFDIKTNIIYPNLLPWNTTPGMIFSFLNYFILISALYIFCTGKDIKKFERLLIIMAVLGLILPQMIVHVEWRYFIATYFLLYYFFVYHFVNACAGENGLLLKSKNYLLALTIGVFAWFIISFGVYY